MALGKYFFFFLFYYFFTLPSPTFALQLKEKILLASCGDYVVVQQNKTYTLIHLHSRKNKELIFEEISIPSHQITKHPHDWKRWVKSGAPGHTSWMLYSADLECNAITECFSFARNMHLSTQQIDSFFTTLLDLDLELLSHKERLRRGASPKAGQVQAKVWAPRQYIEGKQILYPQYDVFTASWPRDGTELAGKKLVFYFDKEHFDFPFPYWIQARSGVVKFKMHAVDSGKKLESPKKELPRRVPVFAPSMERKEGQLVLTMHAPYYYSDFHLYAVDTTVSPRTTHALPTQMTRNSEIVTLSIDETALASQLIPNHRYLWIATPKDETCYLEHPHLFTYKDVKVEAK